MASIQNEFQPLEIQLKDIKLATNNFDENEVIGSGGFGKVYRGEISLSMGRRMVAFKCLDPKFGQGQLEFRKEIMMLSRYTHENLISLIGFCKEGGEMIIVYEYAAHGSLDHYLHNANLTWRQRLKICLDAARGLSYLHDDKGTQQRVLHRDIKSSNILVDENWNAKVSDLGLSKIGPANQQYSAFVTNVVGTPGYCDPVYMETYSLTKESDVYSFGVVLFEVLCGRLCYENSNGRFHIAVFDWIKCYEENKLYDIIFQNMKEQMNSRSLETFSDIAYRCLHKSRQERPTMTCVAEKLEIALKIQESSEGEVSQNQVPTFINELQHIEIQLEEIKSATNNFDDSKVIRTGGFGKVYAGELSHSEGKNMAALKRLDRRNRLEPGFLKEIRMLSSYKHENIISLLGYCNEEDELILAFEHAFHGSLDNHLKSSALTWTQRIKICLDVAKGLSFLHDPHGTRQGLIHCDIKSANILLDKNMNAKIAGFGLPKIIHSDQLTSAVGTLGYCDPLFMETYTLTKESDVYSLGVILFEVLSGRECTEFSNGQLKVIMPFWKQSYEQNKVNEIIFRDLVEQIDSSSLESFSEIAYRCLLKSREERPTMSLVVKKLEIALQLQVRHDLVPLRGYGDIVYAAVPPLIYRSLEELKVLLSTGFLVNGGKTWFSLNDNGEHCVLISIGECLIPGDQRIFYSFDYNSRFAMGGYKPYKHKYKTHVSTQFLSPLVTYTVNLVFKYMFGNTYGKEVLIALSYKLKGQTKTSTVHLAFKREDEWFTAELYQFTSDRTTIDLEILFDSSETLMIVEGIEFKPLEKEEHEGLEDEKVEDMQPISDSDEYWEQKLPNDYENIIKCSEYDVQWTTKKELYSILCTGLLINDGSEWLFLDNNGNKCLMISARAAIVPAEYEWPTLPESRFGEVAVIDVSRRNIVFGKIKYGMLSPETTYAYYIVYKLPQDQSKFEAPLIVSSEDSGDYWYIYLVSPQTPVIVRGKVDENTRKPSNKPKIKGIPRQRSDGWMEVQVLEFQTNASMGVIPGLELKTSSDVSSLDGIMIQGMELRPM